MPKRVIRKIQKHVDPRSNIFFSSTNWFMMAFISGSVNAGGYLACHRFVTHVTGFATLFGVDAAGGNWDGAWEILSVPFFFLFGAMLAAYFIDRPYLMGKKPRYYIVSGLISLCLIICAMGGVWGYFGTFGEPVSSSRDYVLLCFLVLAAGMQNSAATSASSGTVRTTHLTGVTTDLGIGIIRAAVLRTNESENADRESILMWARIGIILSFILGSLVGVLVFMKTGYLGFFLPATLAAFEMLINIKFKSLFESRHSWLRLEPFEHR